MITFIHAIKNYSDNRTVRYGYTASFILVILQVITGALSVITNVNLIIALFHALFIILIRNDCLFYFTNVKNDEKSK